MSAARSSLSRTTRIVVKVGSRVLSGERDMITSLADQIAALDDGKRSFVVVTSGAIALGALRLGYRRRPKEMPRLQASAAAGQGVLMERYAQAFGARRLVAAQVLLTHADLADRERVNNARQALAALMEARAIPVINENDTVSTEEIRFGDNDQLAAMVAPLVSADLLLLLTDVDGVLDEHGDRISVMQPGTRIGSVKQSSPGPGTGGIASKIDAATKGSRSGAAVVIGPAERPNVLSDIISGKDVGTLFPPHPVSLRARQHWIMYTLRPRGDVLIDAGAANALSRGKSSLLPIGVLGVRGEFHAGDAIRLMTAEGQEIGRGLSRLGSVDVARTAGKKGEALDQLIGRREGAAGTAGEGIVVHRDDLVVVA